MNQKSELSELIKYAQSLQMGVNKDILFALEELTKMVVELEARVRVLEDKGVLLQ